MSTGSATPEDEGTLAAEYVLRLLPPEEEAAFERRLRDDIALEEEVAAWVTHFEGLNADYAEATPPRAVKDELMARLFGDTRQAKPPFWQRLGLWQGLSFAALALAGYLALQSALPPQPGAPQPVFVSEIAAEDQSLRLLAVYDPGAGTLQINRTDGAARSGRVLELWAIQGENAPVSLGVLPEDNRTAVPLPETFREGLPGLILAISDEPPGGSPTGAPTGDVLAVGQVTEI